MKKTTNEKITDWPLPSDSELAIFQRDDRVAGVLLGQAAGDALGSQYEFRAPPEFGQAVMGRGTFGHEPGEWTDDSQQMIVVARARSDPQRVASGLLAWFRSGPLDVGASTAQVLGHAESAAMLPQVSKAFGEWQAAKPRPKHFDRGGANGSLMRTGPVCLPTLGTAIALVGSDLAPPAWLDDGDRPDPRGIVATANGLLDVSQGKLLPASAAFFNEVAVPFDYDPDAPPPGQWLKFVAELWPQDADSISLLQEWFGYIVSGRTDLHKICGIFGPPRSGKGTIARVLAELVGVKNTVGPTMAQLGTNFGMQEIPGKALAVISDARLGKSDPRMAVERLLAASGEDRITIDRKYREPWTGTLSARFIVLANEPPVFQDASGAIVTRFVILTTRNTFLGKEDRALTEKLKAELTGILNWSLEGLRRLDEGSGKFAQPESAAEVIQGMREVVSPVGAFLEERCQRGGSEAKETLYAAWLAWCKESRNHPGSIQQFSIDLRAAWPEVRDARPRNGGKRQRRWTGVSLRRE